MDREDAPQLQSERPESHDLLKSAQQVFSEGREKLRALLAEARAQAADYRARQQWQEARLQQISSELGETRSARQVTQTPARQVEATPSVELIDLEDEFQSLRQQQAWIAEKLIEFETTQRRLRAAVKQLDLGEASLKQEIEEPQASCDGASGPWNARVLQAQEDERQRLAREVHDGPAQVLANAIFELEYCERLLNRDSDKLRSELERLKSDMREGLADVRYFIFGLRPAPLTELGLQATLRRYAENYQSRFGIQVDLDLDEVPRLSGTYEVAIFRIIQEALQNTQKHSGAQRVLVRMRCNREVLLATIEDDGRGFDVSRQVDLEGKRFGLISMRERARLIHGELEIVSQPGAGTRVQLTVPLVAPQPSSEQEEHEPH